MSKKPNVKKIAVLSILSAITVIVAFIPLKTLGLEITFTMIPVAVGAVLYGPSGGALIGGVFGAVSFLQCLGYSPFGAARLVGSEMCIRDRRRTSRNQPVLHLYCLCSHPYFSRSFSRFDLQTA